MFILVEKLFMLTIDDFKGTQAKDIYGKVYFSLAGALLEDLAVLGKLAVQDERIVVVESLPTGDDLLDDALELILSAKRPRKAGHWISTLLPKDYSGRILSCLVAENALRLENKRYLWTIPYASNPEQAASAKYCFKEHLRQVVLAGGDALPQDIVLLKLLRAGSLLNLVFTRDERRGAQKKVDDWSTADGFDPAVATVLLEINNALQDATG